MDDTAVFTDTQFRMYYYAFEGLFRTCYHQYRTLRSCLAVWDESISKCEKEMGKIPLVRTLHDQKKTMFAPLRTTQDAVIAQIDSLPKDTRYKYTYAFVQIAEDVIGEVDHGLWPRGMTLANAVKRWNLERRDTDQARLGSHASSTPEEKRLHDHLRGIISPPKLLPPPMSPSISSEYSLRKSESPRNLSTSKDSLSAHSKSLRDNLRGLMRPPQSPVARRSPSNFSDYSLGKSLGYLETTEGPPHSPGYTRTSSNLRISTESLHAPGSTRMSTNSISPIDRIGSASPMPFSDLGTPPSRHRRSSGAPPPSNVGTLLGSPEPSKLRWYHRDHNDGKMGPPRKKFKVEHMTDDDDVLVTGSRKVSRETSVQPPVLPPVEVIEPPRWTAVNTTEQEPQVKIESSPCTTEQEPQVKTESPPCACAALSTPERIEMTGYDPKVKVEPAIAEESPSKSQPTDVTPPLGTQSNEGSPSKEWWEKVMGPKD